ncbi:MAG: low affinity iron permease family protein [Gemmatimonadales bacterium]
MAFAQWFTRVAKETSKAAGHPSTFGVALAIVIVWAVTGPVFHYSDTWQLVINTGTTVITFLMVFLIQNTQNRDSAAMHLKLDELLRAVQGAEDSMANLEDRTEDELDRMKAHYLAMAKETGQALGKKQTEE